MFHVLVAGLSLHYGECKVQPTHQKFSRELSNSKHSDGRAAPHSSQMGGELVCPVNDETRLFGDPVFLKKYVFIYGCLRSLMLYMEFLQLL